MFWTGFAYGFAACLAVGLTARFMQEWMQRSAFIASLSPAEREILWGSRRSRVIGAHSGICRLRMNPSGNAAVKPCVVAWKCGHVRPSRSNPAQARRAIPARRHRHDTAIFKRQPETRATRATSVLSLRVPETRKPAVPC
jgi:hypothetical protein